MNGKTKFKWISGTLSIPAAVGSLWFMIVHFESTDATATQSDENKKRADRIEKYIDGQISKEEAEKEQMKRLCLSELVKDKRECAEVGVKVESK